jgi:hypothetical protein
MPTKDEKAELAAATGMRKVSVFSFSLHCSFVHKTQKVVFIAKHHPQILLWTWHHTDSLRIKSSSGSIMHTSEISTKSILFLNYRRSSSCESHVCQCRGGCGNRWYGRCHLSYHVSDLLLCGWCARGSHPFKHGPWRSIGVCGEGTGLVSYFRLIHKSCFSPMEASIYYHKLAKQMIELRGIISTECDDDRLQ